MSEPQANYETGRPPDFASAPWRAERLEAGGEIDGSAAVWASDGDLVASVHAGIGGTRIERGVDRARLIAAAGTAAHELPDKYDAVKLVRELPEIARLIDHLHDETYGEGDPDLDQPFRIAPSRETVDALIGALASAEDE